MPPLLRALRCADDRLEILHRLRNPPAADMAFQRFIEAARADEAVEVFGDGLQSRDFTYVSDGGARPSRRPPRASQARPTTSRAARRPPGSKCWKFLSACWAARSRCGTSRPFPGTHVTLAPSPRGRGAISRTNPRSRWRKVWRVSSIPDDPPQQRRDLLAVRLLVLRGPSSEAYRKAQGGGGAELQTTLLARALSRAGSGSRTSSIRWRSWPHGRRTLEVVERADRAPRRDAMGKLGETRDVWRA